MVRDGSPLSRSMTTGAHSSPNLSLGTSSCEAGAGDHARIAVHAATPVEGIALCAAVPLLAGDKSVPELIHLLPKSPIPTRDGRGPYSYADAAALIRASMQETDGRLPIDENHATDLAAPNGGAAPARGWIVELQEKPDGIWGKVEWTSAGQQLLADKAYRFISPVIAHHKTTNEVVAILRASLTNTPNMPGLAALNHQEITMNPILKAMLFALGLKEDADETTALQAIETLRSATTTALQSALAPIAKAAGLKDDAKPDAIAAQVVTLAAAVTSTDDKNRQFDASISSIGADEPQEKSYFGITDRDHAWREAITDAAINAYQRSFRSFQAEHEGRQLVRGDPVLYHDPLQEGVAVARLAGRDGDTLTLDRAFTPEAEETYHLLIRDKRGREWGPVLIDDFTDDRTLVLNTADRVVVEGQHGELDDVLPGPRSEAARLVVPDGSIGSRTAAAGGHRQSGEPQRHHERIHPERDRVAAGADVADPAAARRARRRRQRSRHGQRGGKRQDQHRHRRKDR
jgi:phage I-like protein